MPNTPKNEVNISRGKIYFSQTTSGNSTFSGTGVLATIYFKAKAEGTANVSFDFREGYTNESNVSFGGADLLNSVGDSTYTITSNGLPPVISDISPSGTIALVRTITLETKTNEAARCRYSAEPYTAYNMMPYRMSSKNLLDHYTNLSSTRFVVGFNQFYINRNNAFRNLRKSTAPKIHGTGVLLNECFEIIDAIVLNFSLPQQLYALLTNQAPDKKQRQYLPEDFAAINMLFAGGLVANFVAAGSIDKEAWSLTVHGRETSFVVSPNKFRI